MKKLLTYIMSVLLAFTLVLGVTACTQTPSSFKVTFTVEDEVYQEQTVSNGGVVDFSQIDDPTKASTESKSYEFLYWTLNGIEFDESTPVKGNIELVAEFKETARKYTVTFHDDQGNELPNLTLQVEYNKSMGTAIPTATKDPTVDTEYVFSKWVVKGTNSIVNRFTKITSDTEVQAVFTSTTRKYAVNYYIDGEGSTPWKTEQVNYNGSINNWAPPAAPTVTDPDYDYTFKGWYLDPEFQTALADQKVDGVVNLYAKYEATKKIQYFTATFYAQGEKVGTYTLAEGSKVINIPGPEKESDATYNYTFVKWLLEDGTAWDFDNDLIGKNLVFKAQYLAKVPSVTAGVIEGIDVPDYEWEREAAFGEDPDLEEMVIDGKKGADEGWENQNIYRTKKTDAPTVEYIVTTKFSEKGLYVFATADDKFGIRHEGRNYMFKHTHFVFSICDGAVTSYNAAYVKQVKIDSNNVYPTQTRVKAAVNIAEGKVNSGLSAKWNVEMYITWEELGLTKKPNTVKIYTQYTYTLQNGTIQYLYAPYSENATAVANFIVFNENGYSAVDTPDAILGESAFGVAKTSGWDLSKENDGENRYVKTTSTAKQMIFFKQVNTDYYSVEATIEATKNNGKAGIGIYKQSDLNALLTFDLQAKNANKDGTFINAVPTLTKMARDGSIRTIKMDSMAINGKLTAKILYSNGYVYYIVNEKLIRCEFVSDFNNGNMPMLYVESNDGIKFTNYKSITYTAESIVEETSKYAYIVSASEVGDLIVEFDAVGVSTDASSNQITLTIENPNATMTMIYQQYINNGGLYAQDDQGNYLLQPYVNGIQVISKVERLIDGESEYSDITAEYFANTNKGVYTMKNITGNTDLKFTTTSPDLADGQLALLTGKLVSADYPTSNLGTQASITLYSDNPAWGYYKSAVNGGNLTMVIQKGYRYWMDIVCPGFRTQRGVAINPDANGEAQPITGDFNIGSEYTYNPGNGDKTIVIYQLQPNIAGSTASSSNPMSNFNVTSAPATWDCETESEGYITFITQNYGSGTVYFSGKTISDYQYAEVEITNTTDVTAAGEIEYDPAAGFHITSKNQTAFIGLRKSGLRILNNASTWAPIQIDAPVGATVNAMPNLATGTMTTTKLAILRIGALNYMYINDQFVVCHELPFNFDGEAAIGFYVTSSFYCTIRFDNYKILTDDAAKAKAKELIVANPVMDDTCKSGPKGNKTPMIYFSDMTELTFNQNTWCQFTEATKESKHLEICPDIIAGQPCDCTEKEKHELHKTYCDQCADDVVENVVYSGDKMTVNLDLNHSKVTEDMIYIVTIGSNQVILTYDNPSASIAVDGVGDINVGMVVSNRVSAAGKVFVKDQFGNPVDLGMEIIEGVFESQDGGGINFTATYDADLGCYTYNVYLATNQTYKAVMNVANYSTESFGVVTPATAGNQVRVNDIIMHYNVIGGPVSDNDYVETSSAGASVGYDAVNYGGTYTHVDTTSGNNYQYYNEGEVGNFVLKWSYKRVNAAGTNEGDPGVGIYVKSGDVNETILFYQNGYRVLPYQSAWAERHQATGISSADVRNYAMQVDMMIIRRNGSYFMYAKKGTESEYKHVYTFISSAGITKSFVALATTATTGNRNSYYWYNVDMSEFTTEIPEELLRDVTWNPTENGTYTVTGGTPNADKSKYVFNDLITITLEAAEGYVPAYVKVNEFTYKPNSRNQVSITITTDVTIDVVFEEVFEVVSVDGILTSNYGELPATIDVIATYFDGRVYTFNDVMVDASGAFTIDGIRLGEFKIHADTGSYVATEVDVEITKEMQPEDLILTLDTMKIANGIAVGVNGNSIDSYAMLETFLYSHGGYVVKDGVANEQATYLPNAITSEKQFVFSADITMNCGDPNSPLYTPDNVTGLVINNGVSKFAVLFWNETLRVCNGNWSDKGYMSQIKVNTSSYFSAASAEDTTHNLAFVRDGDNLKIYADKHLVLIVTKDSYIYPYMADGTTVVSYVDTKNEEAESKANLTSILEDVFSGEYAIGFISNINKANAGPYNSAMFSGVQFSTDPDTIAEITADYTEKLVG